MSGGVPDGRLRRAVAAAAGVEPREVTALAQASGGDVSRAATAEVAGQPVFLKHLDPPVPGLLSSEAAGLRWLAAGVADGDLAVPEVIGCLDGADVELPVLVLAHVVAGSAAPDHDERLGRGLAALHRSGAPDFGAPWAGFVGPLAVPNDPTGGWPEFLAERRLRPTAAVADERGALPAGTLPALDRLIDRLPALLGPAEPPARLHGDLWAGNAMVGPCGGPVLVDPAAHGGHREVDLAMMRLFGGFADRVFSAYAEVHPLADGHEERLQLLQLHPLLVHAALFGAGYGRRARAVIDAYA